MTEEELDEMEEDDTDDIDWDNDKDDYAGEDE